METDAQLSGRLPARPAMNAADQGQEVGREGSRPREPRPAPKRRHRDPDRSGEKKEREDGFEGEARDEDRETGADDPEHGESGRRREADGVPLRRGAALPAAPRTATPVPGLKTPRRVVASHARGAGDGGRDGRVGRGEVSVAGRGGPVGEEEQDRRVEKAEGDPDLRGKHVRVRQGAEDVGAAEKDEPAAGESHESGKLRPGGLRQEGLDPRDLRSVWSEPRR